MSIIEVDQFKGEQKNLASLLEHVPGLFVHRVTGEGQYTVVKVRGSTGAQVNIYVDGVLQNLGNDIAVDISLIPVSQVARIEVYRGYVPARFAGSPIGGVINIVTKKPEKVGVDASIGYASLDTKNLTLTASTPTFWSGALLVGAHYDQSAGDFEFTWAKIYSSIVVPQLLKREYNAHRNKDFLLKWQNDNFSIKVAKKITNRELPWFTNPQYTNIYRDQFVDHTDLVIGYRNSYNIFDLGIQFHYLSQDKNIKTNNIIPNPFLGTYPGILWDNRNTTRLGGQVDLSVKLGERNLLEFHADYSKENLKIDANRWLEWQFDAGAYLPYPNYKLATDYSEKRWHLQLQDTLTFGPADDMKLTMIARLDGVESQGNARDYNKSMQSWGLAFKKEFNENATFRFTAGTFNRYPNFAERFGDGFYVMPSYLNVNSRYFPNPTWEKGEQWDMGLDLRGKLLGAAAYTSVSYFERFTENMLTMHTNAEFAFYRNNGQGSVKGFEFEGGLYWDSIDLDAALTWLYGSGNFVAPVKQNTLPNESERIANLPQLQFLIRGTYRFPDDWLSVFGEYQYVGPTYVRRASFDIGKWIMNSELRIINIGLNWKITDNFNLTAGVNDLLNVRVEQYQYFQANGEIYRDPVPYPMAGTTFYATLAYSFDSGQVMMDTGQSNFSTEVVGLNESETGGPFYLTPKMIFSQINTKLSGDSFTYGAGDSNGTYDPNSPDKCEGYPTDPDFGQLVYPCYIFPRNANYSNPVHGGELNLSKTSLGLAFGFDLYKPFKVPIRLELEGTLHSRQNITYGGFYGEFGDGDTLKYLDEFPATTHNFSSYQILRLRTYNIFLNGYLDLHNKSKFTPYIGGGIGVTHFSSVITQIIGLHYFHTNYPQDSYELRYIDKQFQSKQRQWALAWNLSIGFSYQITANTSIDLSYRYVDYGKIHLNPTIENGLYSYQFYSYNPGQTLKMTGQQAVFGLRMNL
jgi:outer membrane cobalamin receptor/opacity protein-like surface antigen